MKNQNVKGMNNFGIFNFNLFNSLSCKHARLLDAYTNPSLFASQTIACYAHYNNFSLSIISP